MSESVGEILNAALVSGRSKLSIQQAAEESARERAKQLQEEWLEWESLDEESKQFVLNYIES